LEAKNTLNQQRRVVFHKSRMNSTLLNEQQGMTELRVICAIAWDWQMTRQPYGLTFTQSNQSQKIKKWQQHGSSQKVWTPNTEIHKCL